MELFVLAVKCNKQNEQIEKNLSEANAMYSQCCENTERDEIHL